MSIIKFIKKRGVKNPIAATYDANGDKIDTTYMKKEEYLNSYYGGLRDKNKTYTVRFNKMEPIGIRLNDAVGLRAGINGQINDFDNCYPWCDIKTVVDNKGNHFVRFPKFYTKIEKISNYIEISISGVKHPGFLCISACLRPDGTEAPWFSLAAYEAGMENGKLVSKPGLDVAIGYTIGTYRQNAVSEGYVLEDYRKIIAKNLLMYVEFGTCDMQSIFRGATYAATNSVDDLWDEPNLNPEAATNKYSDYLENFGRAFNTEQKLTEYFTNVGKIAFDLEDGEEGTYKIIERNIVSWKFYDYEGDGNYDAGRMVEITFDGEPLNIKNYVYNDGGDTTYLYTNIGGPYKTGLGVSKSAGSSGEWFENGPFNYRGLENCYGNFYEFVDGLLFTKLANGNHAIMIGNDPTQYANTHNESYSILREGADLSFNSGYISDMFVKDDIMIPCETTASASTGFADYFWGNYPSSVNDYRIAIYGGSWNDEANAGASYMVCGFSASDYFYDVGVRLSENLPANEGE